MHQLDENLNICGKNIRKIRQQLHLSQEELAFRLLSQYGIRIDRDQIRQIEMGNCMIADYELLSFSKVLGVSITGLFGK